jgi:hypothetical protein
MTLVLFDAEQCQTFIQDSKTHYQNPETIELKIIRWKFMGFESHPSHHLFIRDVDSPSNSGRAVLNVRTLNIYGHFKKVTQVTDLLAVKTKASLVTFIDLIKQYGSLGTDCVLHTSNEKSEKIYSSFFKFKEVFELSAFAFPINPQNLFTFFKRHIYISKITTIYSYTLFILMACLRYLNPISLSFSASCDGNIKSILGEFSGREISLLRSEEFWNWRYFNAPNDYKTFTVYSKKKPIGIIATRLIQFHGAHFLLVMDYISSSPIRRWQGLGLRLSLISEAIAQKADAIFGLFNRQNKDLASFYQFPFISIDDKMLPHASPIFASSISPTLKTEGLERMYFSLGDLDYF